MLVISINNLMIYNRLTLLKGNQKLQVYRSPDKHEFYFHLYDLCQNGRHFFKAQPTEFLLAHFRYGDTLLQELEGVLESDVEIDYLSLAHHGKVLLKIKGFAVQLKEQSQEETEHRAKREQKMIEELQEKQAEEEPDEIEKERPQIKEIQGKQGKDTPVPKEQKITNHSQYDVQNRWRPAKKIDPFSPQCAVFELRATFKGKDRSIQTFGTGVAITYHSILTCAHNLYADPQGNGHCIQCQYVEILRNNDVIHRIQRDKLRFPEQYMNQKDQSYRRYDFAMLMVGQINCSFRPLALLTNFDMTAIAKIIGFPLIDKGNTSFKGILQGECENLVGKRKGGKNYSINAQCDIILLREKDITTKGTIKGVLKCEENEKQWRIEGKIKFKNPKRARTDKQGQSCMNIEGEIISSQQNEKEKLTWKLKGSLKGQQFPSKLNAMKYEIYSGRVQRNNHYNQDIYRLKTAKNWLLDFSDGFIKHKITSSKGNSGSPLVVQFNKGHYYMIGIHIADDKQNQMNLAIHLNDFVMTKILQWEFEFENLNPGYKYREDDLELKFPDFKFHQEVTFIEGQPGFSYRPNGYIQKLISQAKQLCETINFVQVCRFYKKIKDLPQQSYKDDEIQQLLVIALEYTVKAFCKHLHYINRQQWEDNNQIKMNLSKATQEILKYFSSEGSRPFFYINMQYHQIKIKILKEILLYYAQGQIEIKKTIFQQLLLQIDQNQEITSKKYNPAQYQSNRSASRYKLLRYECLMRLAMWHASHLDMDCALETYFTAFECLLSSKMIKSLMDNNLLLFRQMIEKYYTNFCKLKRKNQKGKEKTQTGRNQQLQNHIQCLMVLMEEYRIKDQLYTIEEEVKSRLNPIQTITHKAIESDLVIQILKIIKKHYTKTVKSKNEVEYWINNFQEKKKGCK